MTLKKITALMAGALLSGVSWNASFAQQTSPPVEGTVFTVHAPHNGDCPSLDWHVWVGPNGTLSGIVSTDKTTHIWRVTGQLGPNQTFHLDTRQVGEQGKTGSLDGQVQPNGALVAKMGPISGGPSKCGEKTFYIKWFRHGDPGNGAGGMTSGG
jgi:hypothetical protein